MGHTHVSDPETQMVLCVRAPAYVFCNLIAYKVAQYEERRRSEGARWGG